MKVKDDSCLSAGKTITTMMCYRKDREAEFAAIREVSVLLFENKGMISFCPEDRAFTRNTEGTLALWE